MHDYNEITRQLRNAIRATGFTRQSVDTLLGSEARLQIRRGEVMPVRRRLRESSSLTALIRLFVAGFSCSVDETRAALGTQDLGPWMGAGLLAVNNDKVVSLMALDWFEDLLIAFDASTLISERNYVMGPSAPGAALAGLTIRRNVDLTIDLGCGSGLQGLAAAVHSQRVVAYDVNERAIFFTRFNALLNDIFNVEAVEADLFNLPGVERADLVTSNPPYVVSPGLWHQYRDSGHEADAVCRHLALLIPRLLATSGLGQFMANWIVTREQSWVDRLAGWFEGSGCDVWILHETTEVASSYVAKWLRETNPEELTESGAAYESWMSYFEQRGIIGVGYGLVSMQRRSKGPGRVWIEDSPDSYTLPCSDSLAEYLDRCRAVSEITDEQLLAQAWKLSPHLVIEETRLPGSLSPMTMQAHLVRGLCWRQHLTPETLEIIEGCDGTDRLGDIIADVGSRSNLDELELIRALMPTLRRCLERGFLLPAEDAHSS